MADTTLLARIEAAKRRIELQEEARRLEADADKIGDRARTLRSARDGATGAVATAALLKSHGVEVNWDSDSLRSLRSRVRKFSERHRAAPNALLEPNPQLWVTLDGFADALEQRMLAAWQAWVDEAFPSRDEATLATLQRVPELEEGVRGIRRGLAIRAQARSALPSQLSDFDAVTDAAAATEHGWSELVGAGLPAGVSEFLDAARSGDATLAQFTPTVREWFEAKGITHLVRLSIGHRGGELR